MTGDLQLLDFVYVAVGIACLIGLLILRTRPPTPPVSLRTRHRVNKAIRESGDR